MNRQMREQLIKELTLEEKAGMIHGAGFFRTKGVKRLHIPALVMSDGPMGVREEMENDSTRPLGAADDYVSWLPANTALACTWNRKLAGEAGRVLGEEARGRGKDIILAPGVNIMRTPLCGRNFEYMGEDPYLAAALAVPLIKGIQSADVSACIKHFAANNQEVNRMRADVRMSERALREIYLPVFRAAVQQAGVYCLMGAYNRFRGQHCCHNQYLLQDILRGEWGYDGAVVSDWGGVHDTAEAAANGLDIEMAVDPAYNGYYMAEPLLRKVKAGEIPEALIDGKVRNILTLMDRLHMLDGKRKSGSYNTEEHRSTLRKCAEEAVVLLKNAPVMQSVPDTDETEPAGYQEGKEKSASLKRFLLPLRLENIPKDAEGKHHITVIGKNACCAHAHGGGSAVIKALYEITPLLGLQMEFGGNTVIDYTEDPEEAEKLAKQNRTAIVFCGLNHDYDKEDADRKDLRLPEGQEKLISEVLSVNPDAIIVVIAGAPVDMESFADRAKAIVYMSYNGMEGGTALAGVLSGRINPSGKLPFTIPRKLSDCPAHSIGEYPGKETVDYKEGVFVGYRYYETRGIPVRYPFGHGLSYTAFAYSGLRIQKTGEGLRVQADIRNTGDRKGAETAELYVQSAGRKTERPRMELRGFEKLVLLPGEIKTAEFTLAADAFAYYNESRRRFTVPEDDYMICLGSTLGDIRLRCSVDVSGFYDNSLG